MRFTVEGRGAYEDLRARYARALKFIFQNNRLTGTVVLFWILAALAGVLYERHLIGPGPFDPLYYTPTGTVMENFLHVVQTNLRVEFQTIAEGFLLAFGPTFGLLANIFEGFAFDYQLLAHNGIHTFLVLYVPFLPLEYVFGFISALVGFLVFLKFFNLEKNTIVSTVTAFLFGAGVLVSYEGIYTNLYVLLPYDAMMIALLCFLIYRNNRGANSPFSKNTLMNRFKKLDVKMIVWAYVLIIVPLIIIAGIFESLSIVYFPIF